VERLENRIAELEATPEPKITAALEDPDTYKQPGAAASLNLEFRELAAELKTLTAQWEHAATKLAELDDVGV